MYGFQFFYTDHCLFLFVIIFITILLGYLSQIFTWTYIGSKKALLASRSMATVRINSTVRVS